MCECSRVSRNVARSLKCVCVRLREGNTQRERERERERERNRVFVCVSGRISPEAYGVATVSRIDKILSLFCKRDL